MSAADVETLERIYAEWAQGKFWAFELFNYDVQTRWATEVPDIESADGVEGLGDLFARGSGSAIDVEMDNAHVWTMREGRAASIRAYTDRERALREVDLDGR